MAWRTGDDRVNENAARFMRRRGDRLSSERTLAANTTVFIRFRAASAGSGVRPARCGCAVTERGSRTDSRGSHRGSSLLPARDSHNLSAHVSRAISVCGSRDLLAQGRKVTHATSRIARHCVGRANSRVERTLLQPSERERNPSKRGVRNFLVQGECSSHERGEHDSCARGRLPAIGHDALGAGELRSTRAG